MTTLSEAFRRIFPTGFFALPGAAEAARQQAEIGRRAEYVTLRTGMPRHDALRVALFSLHRWAERSPERPFDLGERAAAFVARWCLERGAVPNDDRMHAALEEWRLRCLAEDLGLVEPAP